MAFTFPIYFLEGTKYFRAAEKSREIVRGRWWQVFGNLFLLGLALILVSIVLFALETGSRYTLSLLPDEFFEYMIFTAIATLSGVVLMALQSAANILVQLFAILFTFELYKDYKNTALPSKK
jgi:Na+/proline symporter